MTEVLDADQALVRWRELEQLLFQIPAQDVFLWENRSSCCSAPLAREGKRGEEYEVCSDCGRGCLAEPKGGPGSPPTRILVSLRENLMIEHARLGRAIVNRPRRMTKAEWIQHRLAWAAIVDGNHGSFRGVANAGRAFWPTAPARWTEASVSEMVHRSREIVRERLWPRRGGNRVHRWRRRWRRGREAAVRLAPSR